MEIFQNARFSHVDFELLFRRTVSEKMPSEKQKGISQWMEPTEKCNTSATFQEKLKTHRSPWRIMAITQRNSSSCVSAAAASRTQFPRGVSTTELLPDCEIEAGSDVKWEGNSRTGRAPSTSVAAAEFNSSLVVSPELQPLLDRLSAAGVILNDESTAVTSKLLLRLPPMVALSLRAVAARSAAD